MGYSIKDQDVLFDRLGYPSLSNIITL